MLFGKEGVQIILSESSSCLGDPQIPIYDVFPSPSNEVIKLSNCTLAAKLSESGSENPGHVMVANEIIGCKRDQQ